MLIEKLVIKKIKVIFVSKLRITKNHIKLEVLEKSKGVYDFFQNELYEGNFMSVKVN